MKIWKYSIAVHPTPATAWTVHGIPRGARFLACAEQFGNIVMWYEADPTRPVIPHRFMLFVTGSAVDEGWSYIGTTVHAGGSLVLHIYEADEA